MRKKKDWLRRYHDAIERNWSLEAAKVAGPMFMIAYTVLYFTNRH